MKDNLKKSNFSQFLTIAVLILLCGALGYCVDFILGVTLVYTHLFYLPIVLSAVWYGIKGGIFVSLILILIYLGIHFPEPGLFVFLRSIVFILMGFVVGVVSDKRKQAEEEIKRLNEHLKQRAIELEVANKELESFSYSVSHDLRAPLRSADGFSQVLLEDYGDKLDAQGKDCVRRIHAASGCMAELIDDLLSLSSVTLKEMHREEVNLSTMAQRIAEELQTTQPERQVEFVITPELVANGDANLLRIALWNLLDNTWKFTGKHPRARIEFGVIQVSPSNLMGEGRGEGENKPVYFVRDDGVGFDMTYVHKLFIPFQRLHTHAEFPGTGIGLATVQRIIHRHGGRVWAEGAVEKGATFYFTL